MQLSKSATPEGGAVEALRDPGHPLAVLLGISQVGVMLSRRRTGEILAVNDGLARSLGRTVGALVGRNSAELGLYVHPTDRARIFSASGTGERIWRHDVELRHRDGRAVPFVLNASAIDVGGEPCVIGYFEDLSELRRLAAERERTEEHVRTMFELAPVGLVEAELPELRIVRVNPAMTALTGYAADELLGMRIRDLSPIADRPADDARTTTAATGRATSGRHEKPYLCKDGSIRWVEVRWRRMDDAAGGTPRVIAVVIDLSERRHAESERRMLTAALHAAANGVVISDVDGVIQWVNDAFTRTSGYTADEMLGQHVVALRSGLQGTAFYRDMWETIGAGATWQGELVNRRKDGTLYDEEMTITPVREHGGEITHYISIKQDITARKHVEQARIEAEERYRLALDAAGLGTWQFDVASDTCTFGARAQEQFGVPPTATIAALLAATHPDDRDAVVARIAAALDPRGEGRGFSEHRVVRPDGEVRWLACHAHVTFAGEGAARRPTSTIGTARDITDSRRAAEALRASEDRYRTLVDNLEEIVVSIDRAGILTFVSPAVQKFGYRPGELVGRALAELVHPDDRGVMLRNFTAWLAGERPPSAELRWLDAAGRIRIMRASMRTLVVDGVVAGLTGLATDITAQRETEEQLRAAQRMEAIGRLAGGIAHDFNNLLSVITAYSELAMAELRSEDPLYADLTEIAEATQRAAGLTRQLLAFSRRQVLQPEAVDVGELVTGMTNMLRRLIGEDVELHVELAPRLGTTRVDRGQLEQVLLNLAVNARDAMPGGGHLTVACSDVELDALPAAALELPAGHYVAVEVADTGCGMTPAIAARVFEPFFTTKPVGKGTGLGLSTVHGIIKQSGGGIAVDTAPGRGATFRVYLPCLPGGAAATGKLEHTVEHESLRGHEHILVVEDESALRNVIRRVLVGAGYQVDVAANAGEALLICEQRGAELDLVLTDVVMPGLSGRRLAERLAGLCPRTKIMFMSGYTDDMLAQHEIVDDAFLRKPFDRVTLAAKVRGLLDGA